MLRRRGVSRSMQKGTWAETKVTNYLAQFFPVTRIVRKGSKDEGDLRARDLAIEVKNCGRYNIPGWLREAEVERGHAGVNHSALVVKPNGVGETRMGEWWAVMPLEQLALVHELRLSLEDEVHWWRARFPSVTKELAETEVPPWLV